MIWLYYFFNLILTILLLLPALSGLFFHIPLAKKLIAKDLINDEKAFIKMQWKRFIIFLSLYLIFVAISFCFLGIGTLVSTAINCILCISVEHKKLLGKHVLSKESFLTANAKYFKDQDTVSAILKDSLPLE